MQKIRLSLMLFLILNSGCASHPKAVSFDGNWELVDAGPDQPVKACLKEEDVDKLREILIRCESSRP